MICPDCTGSCKSNYYTITTASDSTVEKKDMDITERVKKYYFISGNEKLIYIFYIVSSLANTILIYNIAVG